MRTPVIAANWKMHKTVAEAVNFARDLKAKAAPVNNVEIIVCPTFTALGPVIKELAGTNIKVAAQNMHWELRGAFTGEISVDMLKDLGCTHVIIGHSERRQYFGETDETVYKKVQTALGSGLIPIVCVGESLAQREAGTAEQVVRTQVEAALQGFTPDQVAGLIVAYEPVWAIGTGKKASDEDAQQMDAYIRKVISGLHDQETAARVRIQYGGSVKPDSAAGLMAKPDVDGALVGGASLEVDSFIGIIKAAAGR